MGIGRGPNIVRDGLVLAIDASSPRSYPGSGTTWYDLSGNNYNVILENGPTYNSSYFSFDGSNDRGYVKSLNYGNGTLISEMSVFAWVRTTYNSGTAGTWNNNNWSILDFDRSEVFTFALNGTGEVQMDGYSSNSGGLSGYYDYVGVTQCNDGNWHYVGWTFSVLNQEIVMYVDGEIDRTITANGSMTGLGAGVQRYGLIGDGSEATTEGGNGNGIYYQGDISSIMFYDSLALTSNQVLQNYNATRKRFGL